MSRTCSSSSAARTPWFIRTWAVRLLIGVSIAPGVRLASMSPSSPAAAVPIHEIVRDADRDKRADGVGRAVTIVGAVSRRADPSQGRWISFSVQDDDAGMVVRSREQVARTLEPGDVVQARGQIDQTRNGSPQLRADQIVVIRRGAPPIPHDVLLADILARRYPGQLVRAVGDLVVPKDFASGSNRARLRDRSGEVELVIPDDVVKEVAFGPRFRHGATVTITGIASSRTARLVAATAGDFAFAPPPPYGLIASGAAMLLGAALLAYLWERRRIAERLAQKQGAMLEALAQSEAGFRSFLQNSPFGVYRSSRDGTLLDVNPAFVAMLGYESAAELRGVKTPDLYRDPGERAGVIRNHPDGVEAYETQFVRKDGTLLQVTLTSRTVRRPHEDGESYEVTVENLTERRRLEQQLRQSQKLEAIGQLAAGVAHDFNNALVPILGYAMLVNESMTYDDARRGDVQEIQKAAERAAGLTRQLLAFSRKQVLQPVVFNVNALILDMLGMLRPLLGEQIELVATLDAERATIKADRGQIEQVVLNLVVNARDAMPTGGLVTIGTADLDVHEQPGESETTIRRRVVIAVQDTGIGMSAETKSHMFDPFFTTKEMGKGTGLGLATVYGIVQQSGGAIGVDSEPGRGTVFRIALPQVDEDVASAEATLPARGASEQGEGLILLVEDEEPVRTFVRAVLERNGYRVLEACDAREGLRLAGTSTERIDLLLTDVVMPGSSGVSLATRLQSTHGGLSVLYMSGYTDDHLEGVSLSNTTVLAKPFTPAELVHKVREVLTMPCFDRNTPAA